MLSYQHHYHAGNHADVLKHWCLVFCYHYLQQKPGPLDYIDTHAGAGLYDLQGAMASKTRESESGIRKLLAEPNFSDTRYLALLRTHLQQNHYPGSPAIINALQREQDASWLFELHPGSHEELLRHCAKAKQTRVFKEDGYQGLLRLLPRPKRRALVLIDPSYEVKDEYQDILTLLGKAYKKMPTATFLLWYPVVDRQRIDKMERGIKNSGIRKVLQLELGVREDDSGGMSASGMFIVNPPWTLRDEGEKFLTRAAACLSEDGQQRVKALYTVGE